MLGANTTRPLKLDQPQNTRPLVLSANTARLLKLNLPQNTRPLVLSANTTRPLRLDQPSNAQQNAAAALGAGAARTVTCVNGTG